MLPLWGERGNARSVDPSVGRAAATRAPGPIALAQDARYFRGEQTVAQGRFAEADSLLERVHGGTLALYEQDRARCALEDAIDIYDRHGAVFDAARSRVALARTLHAEGQLDAALGEARPAVATLQALGAAGAAREAQTLVSSWSMPSKPSAAGTAMGLSRREVEVLRLVAQGESNAAIAAQLHLSEHTVKRHVQNILAKLGLPTRAAAAAHAVREGLA